LEVLDERVTSIDSSGLPPFACLSLFWITEGPADAPHLRKQSDIGTHGLSTATKKFALGPTGIFVKAAACHLQ
jgi:hypothetical protein